jgi:hypothetical protein
VTCPWTSAAKQPWLAGAELQRPVLAPSIVEAFLTRVLFSGYDADQERVGS